MASIDPQARIAELEAKVERMRPFAEHGAEAFQQDWRDRCERAEAEVMRLKAESRMAAARNKRPA